MHELKKNFPRQCPCCSGPLDVSSMKCAGCATEVNGLFELPVFMRLEGREQDFIMEFLKASGSLKDMALRMGVSYPTVRNFLDDLISKVKNMEDVL